MKCQCTCVCVCIFGFVCLFVCIHGYECDFRRQKLLKLLELIINCSVRSLVMFIPVGSCIWCIVSDCSDDRILYKYGSHFQSEFSKSKLQKEAFNRFISTFSGIPDILPVLLVAGNFLKSYVCCLCFRVWITNSTCQVDFVLSIHIKIQLKLLDCWLLLSAVVGTCTWSSVFFFF